MSNVSTARWSTRMGRVGPAAAARFLGIHPCRFGWIACLLKGPDEARRHGAFKEAPHLARRLKRKGAWPVARQGQSYKTKKALPCSNKRCVGRVSRIRVLSGGKCATDEMRSRSSDQRDAALSWSHFSSYLCEPRWKTSNRPFHVNAALVDDSLRCVGCELEALVLVGCHEVPPWRRARYSSSVPSRERAPLTEGDRRGHRCALLP